MISSVNTPWPTELSSHTHRTSAKWHWNKIQGNAGHGWRLLGANAGTKVSQPQKMCFELDNTFWINLFVWMCFFSHEDHQVKVQIHNDRWPPCGLPEVCNQLLLAWLWETSCLLPVPAVPLRYNSENYITFIHLAEQIHLLLIYFFIWIIFCSLCAY